MGWLYMSRAGMGRFNTPKEYLDDQFNCAPREIDGRVRGQRVLASACVSNTEYYAAVVPIESGVEGPAFAIVCMVRWIPRSATNENFGYKDLSERMGISQCNCPERILDLLGPTDNENAIEWRATCRARIAKRKRQLPEGGIIRFSEAIRFTDGYEGQEFVVERAGRKVRLISRDTRARYRVSRLYERDWQLMPQTKVHAAVFPPRA
ncbi:hypothetical protein [Novosphingobium sp. 9U]|uniref:DUF6927 domain-containing protein n=1 Tax=Novosphingobium sp. 9U TaxID=2653158 RepID=UPI0012F0E12D|nr:hypothetical protein [Novosphingobium sp. 9U]VWX51042.1 conserved hypothetical protein [Novosphingobium sp. 9U]